jgi:Rps23 Pro-64 3,4-dihydroxylase Tpa1-like proline 4-hydroxylase
MKKKWIVTIAAIVVLLLCGGVGFLYHNLSKQKEENVQMQKLAEMDKREMENEYAQFANQYSEMKTQITNDSIIAQLDREQQRTESLLAELKRVKSSDAAEIARLKRELVTVRAVMRSYVMEIDSLNRLNQALTTENQQVKAKYSEATQQISSLTTEKQSLSDKVAVAAQLDATNISVVAKNKRGKVAKKVKDVKRIAVSFTITKNITAQTGERTIYVRITQPNNDALTTGATFNYENRSLPYSIKKVIEYTGEEQSNTVYWDVNEFLSAGTYHVYIFAGGNMIGSGSFVLN